MPLIKYNSKIFQPWCEVKYYSIIKLQPGENITLDTAYPKELIFICKGTCEISFCTESLILEKGDSYKVTYENLVIKNADKTLAETSVILRLWDHAHEK